MKNKLIEFLARQIMNLIPKYKTKILLWIGYIVSAYNILLTPEILAQISDAFGYDLTANKWWGVVGIIMTFLINLTVKAKELKHQEEIKIVKMQYNKAA
jgi:hypothetical protein